MAHADPRRMWKKERRVASAELQVQLDTRAGIASSCQGRQQARSSKRTPAQTVFRKGLKVELIITVRQSCALCSPRCAYHSCCWSFRSGIASQLGSAPSHMENCSPRQSETASASAPAQLMCSALAALPSTWVLLSTSLRPLSLASSSFASSFSVIPASSMCARLSAPSFSLSSFSFASCRAFCSPSCSRCLVISA